MPKSKKVIINGLFIGLVALFGVIIALVVFFQGFGKGYSDKLPSQPIIQERDPNRQSFAIRKIRILDQDTGEMIEVSLNGTALVYENGVLKRRKVFSSDRLVGLFSSLTEVEFQNLASKYFSGTKNLVITIETTQGTKTVTVDETGTQPPPDEIEDIIEETEEIEEELDQPPTTPPPTLPPTPIPTPGPGVPTPTPSSTPSPSYPPGQPTPTPQPFDCTMAQTGVTVSNIRCVDPTPSP